MSDNEDGSSGSGVESEEEQEEMKMEVDEQMLKDLEDIDEKIAQARKMIEEDPTDVEVAWTLLRLLKNNGDMVELMEEREKILTRFPLPTNEWRNWIRDAKEMELGREEINRIFRTCLQESPSNAEMWTDYIFWSCEGDNREAVRERIEDAVNAIGFRLDVGGSMWETYVVYEQALMEGQEPEDAHLAHVHSVYCRALAVPTTELHKLREQYEEFAGEKMEPRALVAYKTSIKMLKELEKLEEELEKSTHSFQAYAKYLEWEMNNGDPGRITSFFERALDKLSSDENLWMMYTDYLVAELKSSVTSLPVFKRAVRHCGHSCQLWQGLLLAMEKTAASDEELEEQWAKATPNILAAEDGRALFRTYAYLLKRRLDAKGETDYTKVAQLLDTGAQVLSLHSIRSKYLLRMLVEYFDKFWDPEYEYRTNQAFFHFAKMKDPTKGRKIWDDILKSGGGRLADRWLEAVRIERAYGSVDVARQLFYKAINSTGDHPQKVFVAFVQFEREEGTIEQLEKALAKVNSQKNRRGDMPPPKQKKETQVVEQTVEKGKGKKRGAEGAAAQPAKKSKGTAPTIDIKVDKDGFVVPTMPAPRSPSPSLSAKEKEKPSTSTEGDKPGENSLTLFISNLDFKTTPEEIKEVVEGIVEVRLIHKGMSKMHRGFGYIDMKDEAAVKEALASDRVPIKGRPMYISRNKFNKAAAPEPVKAGFKYATSLEKTKLFIKNVHYDSTAEQLSEVFSAFGAVRDVRIVTHKSGKAKGVAYVEMGTEEAAAAAVAAEPPILLERTLIVLLSNPPRKEEVKKVEGEGGERIGHSSRLQLVPRKVTMKKETDGAPLPPPKGNDFFRQLIAGSKK